MNRFLIIGCGLLWAGFVSAGTSLDDVMHNLDAPISIVQILIEWACYVIGIAFIIGSAMQYRIHRQSPKLTPLFTPIMMLILGIVIVLIPHFSMLPEESWSPKKAEGPSRTVSSDTAAPGSGHWGGTVAPR